MIIEIGSTLDALVRFGILAYFLKESVGWLVALLVNEKNSEPEVETVDVSMEAIV